MKQMFLTIMGLCLALLLPQFSALAQTEQKVQTPEEMAGKEAEKLETMLNLEGWQVFYVDSTLQRNYAGLQAELQGLQDSKVENYDLYVTVRDKWMEKTDNAFKQFLTDEQWERYLKSGAGKNQKLRAKRAEKAKKQ